MAKSLFHIWLMCLRNNVSCSTTRGLFWLATDSKECLSIAAKDNDQMLHWLLNIIKFKSLTGKQRFHKSSNMIYLQTIPEWGQHFSAAHVNVILWTLKWHEKGIGTEFVLRVIC